MIVSIVLVAALVCLVVGGLVYEFLRGNTEEARMFRGED